MGSSAPKNSNPAGPADEMSAPVGKRLLAGSGGGGTGWIGVKKANGIGGS